MVPNNAYQSQSCSKLNYFVMTFISELTPREDKLNMIALNLPSYLSYPTGGVDSSMWIIDQRLTTGLGAKWVVVKFNQSGHRLLEQRVVWFCCPRASRETSPRASPLRHCDTHFLQSRCPLWVRTRLLWLLRKGVLCQNSLRRLRERGEFRLC